MIPLKLTLTPESPFGTPLKGDTLFGQLCWAIVHRFGETRLTALLEGYTEGRPFAVVSDAFPAGFLPRPALPLHRYREVPEADRKRIKRCRWIPAGRFGEPLRDWLRHARDDRHLAAAFGGRPEAPAAWQATHIQPHNTLNRLTGTTGTGDFAPYGMPQTWYLPNLRLDVYLAFDPDRIGRDELIRLLGDIGQTGYGRDASIGLGKFTVAAADDAPWPAQANADAWMTLAPCAPQGLGFEPASSWYQPFTRFGRHGDRAVHSGRPFKTPVLLADTGALLKPEVFEPRRFTGRGLGGDGTLSKAVPGTVHQGYAPVLAIRLEEDT